MRTFYIYIYLILVIFFLNCCNNKLSHPTDDKLHIVNNSDKTIYFEDSSNFPDTLIPTYNPKYGETKYQVQPHSEKAYQIRGSWDGVFNDGLKSGILLLFIFDYDTLNKYTWDQVRSQYKILKRYALTKQHLDSVSWKVIYP